MNRFFRNKLKAVAMFIRLSKLHNTHWWLYPDVWLLLVSGNDKMNSWILKDKMLSISRFISVAATIELHSTNRLDLMQLPTLAELTVNQAHCNCSWIALQVNCNDSKTFFCSFLHNIFSRQLMQKLKNVIKVLML